MGICDVQPPSGARPQLIIAHAGFENGFVPNTLFILDAEPKTIDYHDEMSLIISPNGSDPQYSTQVRHCFAQPIIS